MLIHNSLHDGKSKPASGGIVTIHPKELIKDFSAVRRWDARAIVAYGKYYLSGLRAA